MSDASNTAVGGILMQKVDDLLHPICYASKTLNASQSRYSIIQTDHKSLITLLNTKIGQHSDRVTRWKSLLCSFDPKLKIVYVPGSLNLSDCLSRIEICKIPHNTTNLNTIQHDEEDYNLKYF